MDELKMDARAIEKLIYQQSGLLGVSGISSDMRTLRGERRARREGSPIDLFVYRIGRELGSLAAALGGLDAIVFTAGIGENSRVAARARLPRCGVARRRARRRGQRRAAGRASAPPASRVSAWVIPTNEELMIARHTRRLLGCSLKERAA